MATGKKINVSAITATSSGLAAATSVAVASTAATTTTPAGYTTTAQADSVVTNLNKVIADELNTKAVLAALITELDARGVI